MNARPTSPMGSNMIEPPTMALSTCAAVSSSFRMALMRESRSTFMRASCSHVRVVSFCVGVYVVGIIRDGLVLQADSDKAINAMDSVFILKVSACD